MFDWLFEGRSEIYWLLGILAVIFLIVWWRTRKHGFLIALGSVAMLAGVYFLLGKVRETPRAQIERKLDEMAAAVKAKDADAIFKHIAADFHFRGMDRAAFRNVVEGAMKQGTIDDLAISDKEFPTGANQNTIPVNFQATANSPAYGRHTFPVRGKFVRENDGQWRLQSFDIYNPVLNNQPQDIPNM